MSASPTFGTEVLGQTEKALNAILDRQLAGTGLDECRWITLTLAVTSGGTIDRDELAGRVAGAVKITGAEALALVGELSDRDLVTARGSGARAVTVTDAGNRLHAGIRTAVTEITERMWGDLPPEDLATAGRVLTTVLRRANAELAAG
jgi:hypothetical protein